MVLSGNPAALCGLLGNLQDAVFPWSDVDVFVFSQNNAVAEKAGCQHQVRTCDLAASNPGSDCTSNNTNVFFLPVREEWRTPVEAGDGHKWTTPFPEGYRRMVWRLALVKKGTHLLGSHHMPGV